MTEPIEIPVRSALLKVIAELQAIHDKADDTADKFQRLGDEITDTTRKQTKQTETFLSNLRGFAGRMARQIKDDFSTLLSLNALTESLRFSNMMRGNVDQTIELSNAVRKLGPIFGIAGDKFAGFQAKLTKGLGDIGLSSDVAARALEGLSKTQVRGENEIIDYSKTAGMLASVGRQQGSEGEIARLMADTLMARGVNPSDTRQMAQLAESLRKVFLSTGAAPTETLGAMKTLFTSMSKDMRKTITDQGLTNLATATAVAGPSATKFIEDYLSQSPIERMAFEAQGGKGIFSNQGIDVEKFGKFAKDIMGRIGGDPRMAAKTLGLSDEAAEGFIRLAENLDKVSEAQKRIQKTTGDLNTSYRQSMGLGEAFKANINKVKSTIADPLSWITQKTTEGLSDASETKVGSAAVVAGGALTAAILAGQGLKGVGRGLFGKAKGAFETEAREAITGEKAIPVTVTNFSEITGVLGANAASGGGLTGKGLVGMLAGVGMAIGGKWLAEGGADKVAGWLYGDNAGTGEEASKALSDARGEVVDKTIDAAKNIGTDMMSAIRDLLQDISMKLGNGAPPAPGVGPEVRANIKVETTQKNLKVTHQPSRGASN